MLNIINCEGLREGEGDGFISRGNFLEIGVL